MDSQSRAEFLAQLSAEEKQRLLAHVLRKKAQGQTALPWETDPQEWIRDAKLDPRIQPLGQASRHTDPHTILLTGATGFLGAHLLHDLYDRTRANIYCLVRAADEREAQERLQANFARYFAHPLDSKRIHPLVGDMSQAQLGLSPQTYAKLAEQTDIIVHNGAHLHHIAPYALLKASNVDSTVAILELATTAKSKWIHYVSTLVAAVDRDTDGWLLEDFPQADPSELAGGYSQSKWVSEKLLSEAAQRGIGVTLFRPGFISGRSDNGVWPSENDHLLRVIKGCVQMGYASDSSLMPNMAPVNFVSEAIVRIALSEDTPGQVFNLANPHLVPWVTLVTWLQGCGYPVNLVPKDVWREQHLRNVDKENALFPVLPLYLGGDITERFVLLLSKLATVRNDGTAGMLARLNMSFPVIDQALWQRYVRFFQESGFLPRPA